MSSPKLPSFKRQKWLLLLLQEVGSRLSRTDFQKLLFLVSQDQDEPHFDFVPYRYGCFSYQAMTDLDTLQSQGWLRLTDKTVYTETEIQFRNEFSQADTVLMANSMDRYRNLRGRKLVRYVYEKYPYYALNSEIAREVLNDEGYEAVEEHRRTLDQKKRTLFTIGYEGLKFETYLNRLIQNSVRLLCDVRQNPLSRKYGFSKSTLQRVLPKFGIEYVHVPELGIISSKRKGLSSMDDFTALFDEYRDDLPSRKEGLETLQRLLKEHRRVALTCFEAHHKSCHRHCISDFLEKQLGQVVVHL